MGNLGLCHRSTLTLLVASAPAAGLYPNDDKPRWWRKPRTVQIIEHVSDILLIVALRVLSSDPS